VAARLLMLGCESVEEYLGSHNIDSFQAGMVVAVAVSPPMPMFQFDDWKVVDLPMAVLSHALRGPVPS
jgi:hypothetical protein